MNVNEKYRKLLVLFNNLDKNAVDELGEELLEEPTFIRFIRDTKDFTWEEHDGLLKLLDYKKIQGYYHDKYNRKSSYNNIATLKSIGTEMPLNIIHELEIQKVKEDYKYFKRLYSRITTRTGVQRGESRQYQLDLDDAFLTGEDLAVSFSRQAGKTVGASNFILWSGMSRDNAFNCGIVGNRESTAAEVLDKIKKIMVELPIWLAPNVNSWNTRSIEIENGTRIMTSRPHGDAFRGFSISLLYLDEVAFYKNSEWEEFKDSVFPTMNSLIEKQIIATSTAKGLNQWAAIVKGARKGTNGYQIVENSWKDVPHFDKKGNQLTPEDYRKSIIKRFGEVFFKSTEENSFMGSSVTLISNEILSSLGSATAKVIPEVFHKIRVYEEAQENHSYVIGVDPSGDGIDNFGIQIIDVTTFPFKQVATGALQVDYMLMAEHLNELGLYYNEAFITVEINDGIGTSIIDTLFYTYEYGNLYKERDDNNRGYKKRHGFRTTSKSRNLIIGLMKTFIEENNADIIDEETIGELYTFELNKNGKYEASDGNKDDLVMALAIAFAPFTHIKVMDDHELFMKAIRASYITKEDEDDPSIEDYMSLLAATSFMDSGTELTTREQMVNNMSSYDPEEAFEATRKYNNTFE